MVTWGARAHFMDMLSKSDIGDVLWRKFDALETPEREAVISEVIERTQAWINDDQGRYVLREVLHAAIAKQAKP
jgi:hypothetical protein